MDDMVYLERLVPLPCLCPHPHVIKTASSRTALSSIAHPFALDTITPAYNYRPSSQFCLCSCALPPLLVRPDPHHASLLAALHPREHCIAPNIHHHHRRGLGTPPIPVYHHHSLAPRPTPTKTSRPPYKSCDKCRMNHCELLIGRHREWH